MLFSVNLVAINIERSTEHNKRKKNWNILYSYFRWRYVKVVTTELKNKLRRRSNKAIMIQKQPPNFHCSVHPFWWADSVSKTKHRDKIWIRRICHSLRLSRKVFHLVLLRLICSQFAVILTLEEITNCCWHNFIII